MPHLKLKIVSGSEAGQNATYSFTQLGGSIGRAEDCDWTFLDSDRFVSKKHLVISFRNQQFVLTDVSSNGVIVNNSGAPLGRGNEHIFQAGDTLVIGKHIVQVEDISLNNEQASAYQPPENDGDLLGLIMGSDASKDPIGTPAQASPDIFHIPDNQNQFNEPKPKSDQGLEDILSQPIQSPVAQPFSAPNESTNPFDISANSTPAFDSPATSEPMGTPSNALDSLIPDDWDLFDTKANKDTHEANKSADTPQTIDDIFDINSPVEPLTPVAPIQNTDELLTGNNVSLTHAEPIQQLVDTPPEALTPKPLVMPTAQAAPEPASSEPAASAAPATPSQAVQNTANDDFFSSLYEKLGLSKEFKDNMDREAFAEDIATILLSTTQGLMSLLASRTAFKQESRLSSTLIQPRSNNPIKFSIDPVDTLEMLLVKKKKGYMSVGDSYDEAMEDIQLHQMAFMAGLQGTINGVLAQLDPDDIEQQVNKKSKKFMGLNSNSQCWQIYKEKQPMLAKSVKENLNEVLGNYFSDAYQSQINSLKKEK